MKNILSLSICFALLSAALPAAGRTDNLTLPPGGGDLVGREEIIIINNEDTLADVARFYNLGHDEIRIANPTVEFWLPIPGAEVILPKRNILPRAKRQGIVLNVPEMRLYYFPKACSAEARCEVESYPVAIGRQDWKTPLGTARVSSKVANPSWRPPESIRLEAAADGKPLPAVVPPGPDNPMGAFALYLDLPGYRIHGTNRPFGVGMRATHGCVRMYPEDIEVMYQQVPVGTPVQIVSQPVKFGWEEDTLYMEVHPPLEEDVESFAHLEDIAMDELIQIALERPFRMDMTAFKRALFEQKGMPVMIARNVEPKKTGPSKDSPAIR